MLTVHATTAQVKKQRNATRFYQENMYNQFWSADWSPDGKYIAVAGVDSMVRIFYASNLKPYKSFPIPSWIHIVDWNPDSKIIAVATLSAYVQLIDVESGSILKLEGTSQPEVNRDENGSRAINWNHTGELLAIGDLHGTLKIWNREGKLLTTLAPYGPDEEFTSYLALDWHPSNNTFVAANFEIRIYDEEGVLLQQMEHQNPQAIILCAEWHPSGTFFVIGDYGHNWEGENVPSLLHFWSENGRYIKNLSEGKAEYRNVSWSPDGKLLASASDVLRIWSDEGELVTSSLPDGSNYLWGIDWSPNGKRIVTASRYKTVSLWNKNGRLIKRVDITD
jgi:WD40 repeat protein